MHLAHHGPQVLVLRHGSVLVVGDDYDDAHVGLVPLETSRVVELWDPRSGAWRVTTPLGKARADFVAVALKDGRALIAGGVNDAETAFSSAYVFDPAEGSWTKTGLMQAARRGAAATVLRDGRVLVLGGARGDYHPLATAELFNPRTGRWSVTGSMRYPRYHASAALLGGGRVLVWGGGFEDQETRQPAAEIYDPASGRFRLAPALPAPSAKALDSIGVPVDRARLAVDSGGMAVALANGDALVFDARWSAGQVTVSQTMRYDTSAGRWRSVGPPYAEQYKPYGDEVAHHWGTRHACGTATALRSGEVLCIGGAAAGRVELLDPVRARWTALASAPVNLWDAQAVALADGSVLAIPANGAYTDAGRMVLEP